MNYINNNNMIKIDKKFTNSDKYELSKRATTDLLDITATISEVFEQLDNLGDQDIILSSDLYDTFTNNKFVIEDIINKRG